MKIKYSLISILLALAGFVYASGEISMQGYLGATKGTRSIIRSPGTISIDWVGTKYVGPVVYTATNAYQFLPAINFTNGITWMRNVGTNSAVTLSLNAGVTDHLSLNPSEFYCVRLVPGFSLTNIGYKLTTTSTNYTGNDFEITILEN